VRSLITLCDGLIMDGFGCFYWIGVYVALVWLVRYVWFVWFVWYGMCIGIYNVCFFWLG